MKKMIAIVIWFALLFTFAGCNSQSTNTSESDWSDAVTTTVPSEYSKVIDTEYYTIEIPSGWEKDFLFEIAEGTGNSYTVSFYDKASHEEAGGWLFSINLATEFEDYTVYPAYDVLGSLEVYRIGAYNIVVTYPTDVQFSENTKDRYLRKEQAIPQILESISFKEECAFSADPLAIQASLDAEEVFLSRADGIWHYPISSTDTQTLQISEDHTFSLHYISAGRVTEAVEGTYTIISDDGAYQEFLFEEYGNAGAVWTAKIRQTELCDTDGTSYAVLIYINAENEAIHYWGRTW